jgi:hypothetical protein
VRILLRLGVLINRASRLLAFFLYGAWLHLVNTH